MDSHFALIGLIIYFLLFLWYLANKELKDKELKDKIVYTEACKLNLNERKIEFLKQITQSNDIQKAAHIFTKSCIEHNLDPNLILDQIKPFQQGKI